MFIVVLCVSRKNSMMYTENGGNESKKHDGTDNQERKKYEKKRTKPRLNNFHVKSLSRRREIVCFNARRGRTIVDRGRGVKSLDGIGC